MAEESKALKTTSPELAVETYNSLQRPEQTIRGVNTRLAELGYAPVAKSNLYRWTRKLDFIVPRRKQAARIPPAIMHEAAPFVTHEMKMEAAPDLAGIPPELVEALGLRVLVVAKGTGLDRVEDAIGRVATAISNKGEAIAEQLLATERESETVTKDGETVTSKTVEAANAAKNAVSALATLADAMHRVVAARALISVASRNFAEGDRLSGEAEKYRAEAETTRLAARADNAKNITPGGGAPSFDDAEAEDEALSALREVESQK